MADPQKIYLNLSIHDELSFPKCGYLDDLIIQDIHSSLPDDEVKEHKKLFKKLADNFLIRNNYSDSGTYVSNWFNEYSPNTKLCRFGTGNRNESNDGYTKRFYWFLDKDGKPIQDINCPKEVNMIHSAIENFIENREKLDFVEEGTNIPVESDTVCNLLKNEKSYDDIDFYSIKKQIGFYRSIKQYSRQTPEEFVDILLSHFKSSTKMLLLDKNRLKAEGYITKMPLIPGGADFRYPEERIVTHPDKIECYDFREYTAEEFKRNRTQWIGSGDLKGTWYGIHKPLPIDLFEIIELDKKDVNRLKIRLDTSEEQTENIEKETYKLIYDKLIEFLKEKYAS
jgi:hypothetical protein